MTAHATNQTIFGRRLRKLRKELGLAQDQLGVLIGLDEGTASARMSRYESGVHEPPYSVVQKIAKLLGAPTPYFYCEDDELASLILCFSKMNAKQRKAFLLAAEQAQEEKPE